MAGEISSVNMPSGRGTFLSQSWWKWISLSSSLGRVDKYNIFWEPMIYLPLFRCCESLETEYSRGCFYLGQREEKIGHACAKEDPEGRWLVGCEDMGSKWKGLCPKIGKDPEKKQIYEWISCICTGLGQPHPLPSSSLPSITSLLELLLPPPSLSLVTTGLYTV